jgi:hypothetical protein
MKIKVYVIDIKLPRWFRSALLYGVAPLALLGLGALVYAASPAPFNDGEVLTAKALNDHFDDVKAQITALAAKVPNVTPWTDYAPSVTAAGGGTVTAKTSTGKYRRVGDSIEVNLNTEFSACSGTGQVRWGLPATIVPDAAKLAQTSARIGYGTLIPATELLVYSQGAQSFVAVDAAGGTVGGIGCSTIGSTGTVRLTFTLPVTGWAATGS